MQPASERSSSSGVVANPDQQRRGPAADAVTDKEEEEEIFVEPRWPIAITLLAFILLTLVLRITVPDRESLHPRWLVPVLEIALLIALLAANPAHLVGRTRWLRPLSIGLISGLMGVTMLSDGVLIHDLVVGSKVTESASSLLASGVLVWTGNAVVFGLLYWDLDSGGPLARFRHTHAHPDFAFSQQLNPELAPEGWRPQFVDYMILGITTSTAFSPTDVMPMRPWAKLTIATQSLISLTVIGLVIARAVNAFK
jgi:hypothetical protein